MSALQQEVLITLVKVVVIFGALLGIFSGMTYLERRMLAFMQYRLGPNRTGPLGVLQPIADGIKLFFKEEVTPAGANRWLFVAAPGVAVVTAFMAMAVVPWGGSVTVGGREVPLQIADLDVGILYIFAVSSLGVYGIVLAGWSANNKYTLMGGLRSSAQMFSYELALGLSWVGVIMLASSFRISDIVASQAGGFWNWNISPVHWLQGQGLVMGQTLGFLVYLIAATAEVNRTPFDLPEAEAELVAGFHTEYSSMRFALLQMAEYVNMITVSAIGASVFFGGWLAPVPALQAPFGFDLGLLWFLLKMAAGLFFFVWLRGTLPRVRYDQLMHFGWKVLVPLATLNILATAFFITFLR
ncbi:MAG TPA: NADH-quinone oxidoreductase subunit NuoH [Vicinamibacteria bacterium]|nr:NADH-quinone oxidoreductase subunit NuoH [Vicinamibacteria bacterium]